MSTHSTASSALFRRNGSPVGARSPIRRIGSAFSSLYRTTAARYQMKQDMDQLRALSDDALKDIGINRSEIMSVVHDKAIERTGRRHARA